MNKKFKYPLLSNAFNNQDIKVGINVLKSKFITISNITYNFEKYFAKKIGSRYAVMTNSGSSANLLAIRDIIIIFLSLKKSLRQKLNNFKCWIT